MSCWLSMLTWQLEQMGRGQRRRWLAGELRRWVCLSTSCPPSGGPIRRRCNRVRPATIFVFNAPGPGVPNCLPMPASAAARPSLLGITAMTSSKPFLLNLTCAGNISTMSPRQNLFSGRLALIRPLAYLDKSEIEAMGRELGMEPVRSNCPLSEKTRRREIHQLAEQMYQQIPGAKANIFAALGNVRQEYLLKQTGGRRP